MAENYYDKQIIPLKVRNFEAEAMSLDTGYYIEGRLETFSKEQYFDDLLSIYIPESFIDMPDEIKEIKYPTNFRPEIIKTNLAGDINFSFSLLEESENADVETLVGDFVNLLSKAYKGIKFLDTEKLNKEDCIEIHCFDFILPGIDEKNYHIVGMGKTDRKIIQLIFNCREHSSNAWKKAATDIFRNIELIRK